MRRLARLVLVATLVSALTGCASWTWWPLRPAALLLQRANRAADELRFRQALALYDEFLTRYPDDVAAPRALESRDTVAAIVTTRDELIRLRSELRARELESAKLRDDAAKLREDVTRLRQELASRQAESDKLRADLERIKELDLKLERRR